MGIEIKEVKPEKLILVKQPRKLNDPAGLHKMISLLTGSPTVIFDQARETISKNEGADITTTHIPGLGKAAVVESYRAADIVLSDTENFLRDPAVTKVIANLLGGKGPLTVTGYHPGAAAVTAAFGTKHLRESGFMNSVVKNQEDLFTDLIDKKGKSFAEIAGERNIAFLAEVFFNNKVTPAQMQEIYEYPDSIFANLLKFVATGKKTEDKLPESFKKKKARTDRMLNTLIHNRVNSPSSKENEFDLLDFLLKRMPEPKKADGITENEYQHQYEAWRGEIRSTIYQVTFAAKDTTDAALGFAWNYLTKPENFEKQKELRTHAKNFFAKKEKNITFNDLESGDKDILPFLKFFGHILAEFPPTPIDMRLAANNMEASNGTIEKGVSLVIDIESCTQDQVKSGYEPKNPDDLANLATFGRGPNSCKGAWFAIARGTLNLMTILNLSDHVSQFDSSKTKKVTKSTQRMENLYLNVVKK